MDNLYKNKTIYIIHYPEGREPKYSVDVIKSIDTNNIKINHLCSTERGSSGGPLLNLQTYRVIGMHRGKHIFNNWNIGVVLKFPIFEFNKKYNKALENKENRIKKGIKNNINKNNAINNEKYLSKIKIKEGELNDSVNNIKKKVGESILIGDEKKNFNKINRGSSKKSEKPKKLIMRKEGLTSCIPLVEEENVEGERIINTCIRNSKILSKEMKNKLENMNENFIGYLRFKEC